MIVFSEKTPERPPALGPAHLSPHPHCVEMGFTWTLLGTQNVTPNQILVVLKFRYFEKDTKI